MDLQPLWRALAASPLGDYIGTSGWAFPTIESVHVIAITLVIGVIAVMDLRLLGWAGARSKVTEVEHDTLKWTWAAFVLAVITGGLLFVSRAPDYMLNPYFRWKLVVMALAGVNMAVFHLMTWRSVAKWDLGRALPRGARLAGATSLVLWIGIVFLGRMIGFTLDKFAAG